jgi:hypothetical protein
MTRSSLATLFAIPEFDIRAVILDLGMEQERTPGSVPLRQIMHLSGRSVPYATGLGLRLRYPEDAAGNQFPEYQGGVNLLLQALRDSKKPVVIIAVGSLRDVAAAYNREPALFRDKVFRIYVDDGNSGGEDMQWNPQLDPQGWIRIFRSGLPLYWFPVFGPGTHPGDLLKGRVRTQRHQTYWAFWHEDVFGTVPLGLQQYFLYALGRRDTFNADPIATLSEPVDESLRDRVWSQSRNMWSTASLLHASGRNVYRRENDWIAQQEPLPGYERVECFDTVRVSVRIDRDLRTNFAPDPAGSVRIFRVLLPDDYQPAMQSILRHILTEFPMATQQRSSGVNQ